MKYYADKLINRHKATGKKSAIINVSADFSIPFWFYLGPFLASTMYTTHLSLGVGAELKDVVDVMAVHPNSVKSRMNIGWMLFTLDVEEHVRAVIDKLGYEELTVGHW